MKLLQCKKVKPMQTESMIDCFLLFQMKKSVNKSDTFDLLPDRLRTDIAIHIHLDTLSKVSRKVKVKLIA